MPLLEQARNPIERCLADLNIGKGEIDAVVLVGGTCRIPAVRNFVRDLLGVELDPDINPMTAVGEGAAIAAAILSGSITDTDFFVATEHALGTYALNAETGQQRFSTLIPRGHKLPAVASDDFAPVVRETEGLTVEVIEGDPDAENPDFTPLKEWYVELPKTYDPNSDRMINIEYKYDVDGILQVTVKDIDTGVVLLDDDVSYGVAADKRGLKKLSDKAQESVRSGQIDNENTVNVEDPESLTLITQARIKVLPFLDESESELIENAVVALETASASDVVELRAALSAALRPYSYLF